MVSSLSVIRNEINHYFFSKIHSWDQGSTDQNRLRPRKFKKFRTSSNQDRENFQNLGPGRTGPGPRKNWKSGTEPDQKREKFQNLGPDQDQEKFPNRGPDQDQQDFENLVPI